MRSAKSFANLSLCWIVISAIEFTIYAMGVAIGIIYYVATGSDK